MTGTRGSYGQRSPLPAGTAGGPPANAAPASLPARLPLRPHAGEDAGVPSGKRLRGSLTVNFGMHHLPAAQFGFAESEASSQRTAAEAGITEPVSSDWLAVDSKRSAQSEPLARR